MCFKTQPVDHIYMLSDAELKQIVSESIYYADPVMHELIMHNERLLFRPPLLERAVHSV